MAARAGSTGGGIAKAALGLVAVGALALVALLLRGIEREPVRVEPRGAGARGPEEPAPEPRGGAMPPEPEPELEEDAGPEPERAALARGTDAAHGARAERGERSYPFSLRVALVDERGLPLECCGVELRTVDVRGVGRMGYVHRPGFYELRELEPGRWWLRASAIGRRGVVRELLLPASDAGLELELALPAAPLVRVRVALPDGEDIASGRTSGFDAPRAFASVEPAGARIGPEEELAAGAIARWLTRNELDLEPGELGRLELRRDPPLWVNLVVGEEVLESSWLAPGVEELVFTLDPERLRARFGEVRVRAVDASGARLSPVSAAIAGRHGLPRVLEPAGGLRLQQVPPGPGTLELRAPGYGLLLMDIDVPRGETLDLGDVTLELAPALGLAELEALQRTLSEGATVSAVRSSGGRLQYRSDGRWHDLEGREPEEPATLLLLPSARRLQVVLSGPDRSLRRAAPIDLFGLPERVELSPGEYELRAYADDGTRRSQRFTLPAAGLTLQLD